MSGFKDDVISILRQNHMLQKDSIGLVLSVNKTEEQDELVGWLTEKGQIVIYGNPKDVIFYDYVVVSNANRSSNALLKALSLVHINGLVILEVSNLDKKFDDQYNSWFGTFTATKVVYDKRVYMVIHSGVDYGN